MPLLNTIGGGSLKGYGRKGYKPGAPTIGTATANGASRANVTFTAPLDNGGAAITSYTATSSPGNKTGTLSQAGSGTIQISCLTSCTAYTFTVYATNKYGNGASSSASNSITPQTPAPSTVSVLMYGGGGNGGGGNGYSGGGGGGAAGTTGTVSVSSSTTYSVTVAGAGGTSSFITMSAAGGGCGGTGPYCGFGGTSGSGYGSSGSGGGGFAGPGTSGCWGNTQGGPGTDLYVYGPYFCSVAFGGGGGGGATNALGYPFNGGYPTGGSGGGYAAGWYFSCDPGIAHGLGGGAGGGGGGAGRNCFPPYTGYGGPGGAGWVIIWYDASFKSPTAITGSYSQGTGRGFKYYAFSSSGTIRW